MKTCQFLAAFSFFLYGNWCNNRIICAMSAPNRPKSMNTRGCEEHTEGTWCTGQCTPCTPLHQRPCALLEGMLWWGWRRWRCLFILLISMEPARQVPFTLLTPHSSHTHTHMHTYILSSPHCPSLSLSHTLFLPFSYTHTPHKMLLNGNIWCGRWGRFDIA